MDNIPKPREVLFLKRFSLLMSIVLVAVLLTGCLTPKVNVSIAPNPIRLYASQLFADDFYIKNLKLHLVTSGFSTSYKIEGAEARVLDDKGNLVSDPIIVEIDKTTLIAPGFKFTEDGIEVSLRELFDDEGELTEAQFLQYYNGNWKGKVYELVVTITGKNPTSDKAAIRFE